jgi:hypothetical protein
MFVRGIVLVSATLISMMSSSSLSVKRVKVNERFRSEYEEDGIKRKRKRCE